MAEYGLPGPIPLPMPNMVIVHFDTPDAIIQITMHNQPTIEAAVLRGQIDIFGEYGIMDATPLQATCVAPGDADVDVTEHDSPWNEGDR